MAIRARNPDARVSTRSSDTAPLLARHRDRVIALVLVTFLLVFPKGGVKVGGIPVTWGYLLLGVSTLPFLVQLAYGARMRLARPRLVLAASLIPFQFVVWGTLLLHGTSGMGFAVSLVVSFFFIPLAFLLALGVYLDRMELGPLFRMLRTGILLVAAYGIFLFIFKLKTGHFIEIPYLTVNAGDVGGLEDKYIDRGGIFKLISTYNNGNIYGVSMLLLLPLYGWLERSRVRQGVVKASLLLTLSRTVWVGLVVYEVLQRVYVKRVSARALVLLCVALLALGLGVAYALSLMDRNVSFLFDRNLGGRLGQLGALETARILPDAPFETIYEIVYLSVMESFGILGLAAFLVAMATPVALQFLRVIPYGGSVYKRSLATGLLTYLVVAMSDGALLLIPVMVFYWFVVSLLVSDNPSFAELRPALAAAEPRGGAGAAALAAGAPAISRDISLR